MLTIAARNSKTGGARRVELCAPLRRLLKRCRRRAGGESLCPRRWGERWRLLRLAAGVSRRRGTPWVPDVLRHTFASYHALTHRNLPALQLQLGHRDARLLLTRYLNTPRLRRAESPRFWQLAGQGVAVSRRRKLSRKPSFLRP